MIGSLADYLLLELPNYLTTYLPIHLFDEPPDKELIMNESRIGVVGIVIEPEGNRARINEILHDHSNIIVGRMGLPNVGNREISVISVVVDGTTDHIGSLTGRLGALSGVNVKSALSKKSYSTTVEPSISKEIK